jgi:hypothetical protein
MHAAGCASVERSLEKAAALLERAYRLALVLQGRTPQRNAEAQDDPATTIASAFEDFVMTREFVAVLDEARVELLVHSRREAGFQGPARRRD